MVKISYFLLLAIARFNIVFDLELIFIDILITIIEVDEDNWLANKKLKELRLTDEGIAVLSIERRDLIYIGAPYGNTCIYPGDTLIVYGRKAALIELDVRGFSPY